MLAVTQSLRLPSRLSTRRRRAVLLRDWRVQSLQRAVDRGHLRTLVHLPI